MEKKNKCSFNILINKKWNYLKLLKQIEKNNVI
jgi:hypothetical protein